MGRVTLDMRQMDRFAHNLQASITVKEGPDAWDLLPDRATNCRHHLMTRDSRPGILVRWRLSPFVIRVPNRAINLHDADIPYA